MINNDNLPDGWSYSTMSNLSTVSAGGDKPKIIADVPSEKINVPVYSNGLDRNGLYGYTDKARIMEKSVTISARGTIGFVCLRFDPFVPIVRLITITPTSSVSAEYLYLWLLGENILGTGTTQQQLVAPEVKKWIVVVPTADVLKKIDNYVSPLFAQLKHNIAEIGQLTKVRDYLLPKLMSGGIDVSTLDIPN